MSLYFKLVNGYAVTPYWFQALESVEEALKRLENLLQELHVSSSHSGKEQLKAACSDLEKIRKLKKEAEFLEASFRAKEAFLRQVSSYPSLFFSYSCFSGIPEILVMPSMNYFALYNCSCNSAACGFCYYLLEGVEILLFSSLYFCYFYCFLIQAILSSKQNHSSYSETKFGNPCNVNCVVLLLL